LKARGFGAKWIRWIEIILNSGTFAILLNEFPSKQIYYKIGVRQGDHISPLLFVLAADLLQSILNKALLQGNLTTPIACPTFPDFYVIQYADDTLVVMQANSRQLICLKSLLNIFADSIGLKVNYHKSIKVPLNVDDERLSHFTNTLHCKKRKFPFLPTWDCPWVSQNHLLSTFCQWLLEWKEDYVALQIS
jgi:hypothetical protein